MKEVMILLLVFILFLYFCETNFDFLLSYSEFARKSSGKSLGILIAMGIVSYLLDCVASYLQNTYNTIVYLNIQISLIILFIRGNSLMICSNSMGNLSGV